MGLCRARRTVRVWLGMAAAAAGAVGAWGGGASTARAQAVPGGGGGAAGGDNLRLQEQRLRDLQQLEFETRLRANEAVPPGQRALIDYGAYLTFSYLSFDDQVNDDHAFRGADVVGYGRVDLDDAHEFYLRARGTYRGFNPGDNFQDEPSHVDGHVEEAWYKFDLRRSLAAYEGRAVDDNLTVQAGRQFETWAGGLVLSQYVDGVRVVADHGPFTLEALASITAHDLTVDFDASRPFFEKRTRRAYYGGMLSVRVGPHKPFVYALVERDRNSDGPVTVGPLSTRYRYNGYYLGAGSTGGLTDRLLYGVEGVFEGGRGLSSSFDPGTFRPVRQEDEGIHAYAGEVRLDYLLTDARDPRRSRVGAGLLVASGDPDRRNASNTLGGNRPGTDDRAFNALGFVADGLAFNPTFSNLLVVRGTASTYPLAGVGPFDQLQVGVDVFAFGKTARNGAIDEPTEDRRYLGFEPDVFVNWQAADDVTLVLRYGIFFPGDAVPSGDARQFFYAGLTYAF